MRGFSNDDKGEGREPLWTSLFLMAFGIAVLAFLIVIDRQEWMSVRPASGTAAAMSYASQAASGVR
ncbi:MAG: hypothetical protein ABW173_11155 [Sphingomonas sp.]